jgi:hypothetical protein
MGGAIVALQAAGYAPASWRFNGALFGLNILLILILVFVLDRGRIVSPAYSRLDRRHLEGLRAVTAARSAPQVGAEAIR